MSTKRFYPATNGKLLNVVSLEDFALRTLFLPDSPYKRSRRNFLAVTARTILLWLLSTFDKWFGVKLYIENKDLELDMFSSDSRKLLARLLSSGMVTNWNCGVNNTDYISHYVCNLVIGDIFGDNSKLLCRRGALTAHGSATDLDTALVIAMAEGIERIVSSQWFEGDLIKASIQGLRSRGEKHMEHSYFGSLSEKEKTQLIGWGHATDLFSGERVLVPASLLYLYYPMHSKAEPSFAAVSSNGVATHSTKRRALLNAIYESFERDGFLIYWLNSISPRRIDLATIAGEEEREIIENLEAQNLQLDLLDCRTEYDIPVVVSVLIDKVKNGVYVHAASGLNVDEVVKKLLADNQRFDGDYDVERPEIAPELIPDMYVRMRFWHGGFMRDKIDWFLTGPKVSYEDYQSQFKIHKDKDELAVLKQRLSANKAEAYYYEYHNRLSANAGLHVVRAIIPDLVPIYFDETKKHLNVPRLYNFAKLMGYKERDITKDELNSIPHPFV